jgi:hypothetical protein
MGIWSALVMDCCPPRREKRKRKRKRKKRRGKMKGIRDMWQVVNGWEGFPFI